MRFLSALLVALCGAAYAHAATPTPNAVTVSGSTLMVDGAPFKIHGVAYSPVPVGESPNFLPYGDYYTHSYSYIWARDLPLLKAEGFNTIRIYSWANAVDHTLFLDLVHSYGMKVILTHYVGTSTETPILTAADRDQVVADFEAHVQLVGDHPALLMWSFGNEMNGPWNGFMGDWSTISNCKWQSYCTNTIDKSSDCFAQSTCVYNSFFPWLQSVLAAGKKYTTRPMTTTMADLDVLVSTPADPTVDKVARFESLIPALDVWAIQLYRGQTIADFLVQYAVDTQKPLLVGEFGVDAMNDPCGWPANRDNGPCYFYSPGQNGQPGGADATDNYVGCTGKNASPGCMNPGVTTQATWDSGLANEIIQSTHTVGGIVMAWHDELWKNVNTQDMCGTPCAEGQQAQCATPGTTQNAAISGCTAHAHIDCPEHDALVHAACGYYLQASPDAYVNEAWFGLHYAEDCGVTDGNFGHRLSALTRRPVVSALATLYSGANDVAPRSCSDMQPCWACSIAATATEIASGKCDSQCLTSFASLNAVADNSDEAALASSGASQGGATQGGSTTTGSAAGGSTTTGSAAGGTTTTPGSSTTTGGNSNTTPGSGSTTTAEGAAGGSNTNTGSTVRSGAAQQAGPASTALAAMLLAAVAALLRL